MSAFIVGKEHIDYLIDCARAGRYPVSYWQGGYGAKELDPRVDDDLIGRLLWVENVKSVAHRYPNDKPGDWPGPRGLDWETVSLYRHSFSSVALDPVQGLKAVRCYEYQSCTHPGWAASDAKAFCEALTARLIDRLPGYEEADWEITAPSLQATRIA